MHVPAWLPRAASARPQRIALETRGGALTYAQLDRRAAVAAGMLADRGVTGGDRVALALPAGEGFVVALHACLRMGAVAMPIDLRLGLRERRAQEASAATVLDEPLEAGVTPAGVCVPACPRPTGAPASLPGRATTVSPAASASSGRAVAQTHDLLATALVVHTSGTTAAPEPVELTYGNLLWSALGSAVALGLDAEERWLCPLPLTHVGGLSVLARSAIAGTTAVVHPGFDAGAVGAAIAGEGITVVSLVPTMLARLLDAGARPAPALRWALVGGAALDPSLAARAREAGLPVAETYGLSEACSQVATRGAPLFCTRVEISTEEEILVSGPTVAPKAAGADGWLRTGDVGRLDERGRLVVTGRAAERIVTGGENVAPAEVEAALLEHPAVAEAAVHGRRDPEWGEAVTATVVLRPHAAVTEDELRAHAAGLLAGYKVPKAVSFVDALPRTASGKVRRRALARLQPGSIGSSIDS